MDKPDQNQKSQIDEKLKEIDDKLKELELRKSIHDQFYKNHLSTITIIFVIVGLVLGVFSFKSSNEITDAIKFMYNQTGQISKDVYGNLRNNDFRVDSLSKSTNNEVDKKISTLEEHTNANVDKAIQDMKSNFDKLAGESLRKPNIKIYYNDKDVTSQEVYIEKTIESDKSIKYYINNIKVVNKGDRTAQITSNKLVLSEDAQLNNDENEWIDEVHPNSFGGGGRFYFYSIGRLLTLSPEDSYSLPLVIRGDSFKSQTLKCDLSIYYDLPPTKVTFILKK